MAREKIPYKNLQELPPHIFRDVQMRDPVGKEFRQYLRYMLENHNEDLQYIHRRSQTYVEHGGAFYETFPQWRTKLKNKLKKYEKEDGIK